MRKLKFIVTLFLSICFFASCSKDNGNNTIRVGNRTFGIKSALIYYEGYQSYDEGKYGYAYSVHLSDAADIMNIVEDEDDGDYSFLFSCFIYIPEKSFKGGFPFRYGEYDEYYIYPELIVKDDWFGFTEGNISLDSNGSTYTIDFEGTGMSDDGSSGSKVNLSYSGKAIWIDETVEN